MINRKLGYVCIVILSLNSFAVQLTAQAEAIRIGISFNKYTVNRFNYEPDDSTNIDGKGFTIGFAFEKPILKKTSVLIGFGFSQRNNEVKYFNWPNSDRSHWASFPLSINYYLFKNFSIEAGCQFDHLIFKQKFVYYSDSLQLKSGYAKFDIGLITGLRFQLRNFELHGSLNYGLRKLTNTYSYDPIKGIGTNFWEKSYSIKLGLNYLFQ